MADLPDEMLQKDRQLDPVFRDEEWLYRRVPHELWDDDSIELDAIELPDMSVNRQKYSKPAWVRLDRDEYSDWGVIGFQVQDIPPEIQDDGAFLFPFRSVHVPLRRNYSHTEVRAYESPVDHPEEETHIGKALMNRVEPEVHLRWRERLRRKCRIILRAYEVGG